MTTQQINERKLAIPAGIHQIRIFGEPRPAAKDEIIRIKVAGGNFISTLMKRDYQTRTDPITKKKVKYNKGHKQWWVNAVRLGVFQYMYDHKLAPYPKNYPIAMGTLFFVTKPASNKMLLPARPPDEDNFDYAVKNALKRTIAKRNQPSPYPGGLLYYEDDQICWRIGPSGKIWATEKLPPGVLITVASIQDIHHELGEYDPYQATIKEV